MNRFGTASAPLLAALSVVLSPATSAAEAPVGYEATDHRAMRTALVTEVGPHKAGAKMTHADAM